MMPVYRCDITLMEATFFSSREISKLYQTEPLLGNYALAYAFGFVQSAYYNDGTIHYAEHFADLNAREIYVTPGTLQATPKFLLRRFNVQPDTYFSQYGQGFIAVPPAGGTLVKASKVHPVSADGVRGPGLRATNRPQEGRLRLLASGNHAVCYVISPNGHDLDIPAYIRLGKFMSKARVDVEELRYEVLPDADVMIDALLNPADIPTTSHLLTYNIVNVPPAPLVHHARVQGRMLRLSDGTHLPDGMRFGIGERTT